jgi:hypothetical protein
MLSNNNHGKKSKNSLNILTNFCFILRPKIYKLCVVRTFTDIEELVGATTKLETVLGKLGKTPYEPMKEEHEDGMVETMMEKNRSVP